MAGARAGAYLAGGRRALRSRQRRRLDSGARTEERPAARTAGARNGNGATLPNRRRAGSDPERARYCRGAGLNRAEELEVMLRVAREASTIVARIYATNF